MVELRVEQLLNVEDAECNIGQVHLDTDDHDFGETATASAAEHVERFLDVHLGELW